MIVRSLLRLAAVRAIRGHTLAGDRIFDSELGLLNGERLPTREPFVAIYADSAKYSGGFGLMSPEGEVGLIVEIVAPSAADGIAGSDAGLELTVDLLERQVRLALSDPSNPWVERLLTFAEFAEVEVLRGSSNNDDGVRFVARQMTIRTRLMFEPIPGQPAPFFDEIIASLEADNDPESSVYSAVFRQALQPTSPHWAQVAARVGLSAADADLLGLADDPDAPLQADAVVTITRHSP